MGFYLPPDIAQTIATAVSSILRVIPRCISDQVLSLSLSLDLHVVDVLFLLAYQSFEPQIAQLVDSTLSRLVLP